MKRYTHFALIFIFFLVLPMNLMAEDYLAAADGVYDQGGLENYKKSIDLYLKAVQAQPESYEANWKCARAYREYCEQSIMNDVQGWKQICKTYAKEGMKYGEKAIELNDKSVEGHYFYGLSVGNYADGVSILKALKEGLKGKTQKAFEKAYEIDKMYEEAGPILAIGRFWSVLPWPLKKRKKAISYFQEAYKFFPDDPQLLVYYGEILMEKKKDRSEAKKMLDKAVASGDSYYSKVAMALLAKL